MSWCMLKGACADFVSKCVKCMMEGCYVSRGGTVYS
jgi:hypothetical protein